MITDPSGHVLACTRAGAKRLCGRPAACTDPQMCAACLATTAGITYRQLDYWSRRGFLRPENNDQGSGSNRIWPPAEVEIARRLGFLAAAGLPLEWSAGFARDQWPGGILAPGIHIKVEQ